MSQSWSQYYVTHREDNVIHHMLEIYRVDSLVLGTLPSSLVLTNIRLLFCIEAVLSHFFFIPSLLIYSSFHILLFHTSIIFLSLYSYIQLSLLLCK